MNRFSALQPCHLALVVICLLGMATANGEVLEYDYSFEPPIVSTHEYDGRQFHSVSLKDAPATGAIGRPSLPAKGVTLLLPYGTDLESIEVVRSDDVMLDGDYLVEPGGYPIKLSDADRIYSMPPLDLSVYGSPMMYPQSKCELVDIQSFRGFSIAVIRLHPVRYVGVEGKLYFSESVTVQLKTRPSVHQFDMFRGLPQDAEDVCSIVDNPEFVMTYPVNSTFPGEDFELLIITIDALIDAFTPLKDYHDTTGIATEIRFVETDIGSVDPVDIRDYIRERYLNDGIDYVLIGADDDLIPAKDLYVLAWTTSELEMPGDIYYSCLDGSWNWDGDLRWGEPNDGEGGGEVDLMSDVYVGRACVSNPIEVNRFVDKTIQYLALQAEPYLRKVLLTGEYLSYPDMKLYGAYAQNLLVDGSSDNGYTTIGFPSDIYEVNKLYDLDWPGGGWPASEVVDRINSGQHMISHLGHSNYEVSIKLHQSELDQLTNADLCFFYNEGCHAGWFDGRDCWAEEITIKIDHGAFAAIMNARYGWVEGFLDTDRSDGPSNRFAREFWDAVYNPAENMPELGRANADSKHDNIWRINFGANRWVAYELNLFGDPTIALKRPGLLAFDCPGGLPEHAMPEEPIGIDVSVIEVNGGEVVPGSEVVYYAVNDGEFQLMPLIQLSKGNYSATLPALQCGQSVMYYFAASEVTYGEYLYGNPDNPFRTIAAEEVVTLFEDDFEDDLGWNVSGGMWQRGVPTGQGGEHTCPDPTSGCAGPNVYGYNLNGDYQNNLPEMHLTSPVIDCSGHENIHLKFSRWLGVEQSDFDHASVRVSTNGVIWDTLWHNVSAIADGQWTEVDIDLGEYADQQSMVYLRWTMGETSDSMTYCGWNIDDVRVISYVCPTYVCGDPDASGSVDIDDVVFLINCIFTGGPEPQPYESGDADCSDAIDIDDVVYLIAYIFTGGYAPCDIDGDENPDC